ncbi:MAG TPA: O-methyltransferase [Polyangia bacterium]
MNKTFGNADPALADYVYRRYQPEDDTLAGVRTRSEAAGLPDIQVAALDARHLEVLVQMAGVRRAVEIGTLGGYSSLAIVRGMGPEGILHTIEIDPRHAEVAAESFRRAGVSRQIVQWLGPALEVLPKLSDQGPFDFCFLDAVKAEYPNYLDWAAAHLRPGGIVAADNAFLFGDLPRALQAAPPEEVRAMDAFHKRLASSSEFRATVLPTGEGLALGVRR